MLTFPEDYFLGETRNDFYIEPMMKCVWAAQLEVLEVIRDICEKHNIPYFAAYGTLLGVVRHKGFIPWDDDVDLLMLRKDYERFWKIAPSELPDDYHVQTPYTMEDYSTPFGRVVNTWTVSYSSEQLRKFHGCPYIVGVDIFPYDTLPLNHEQELRQAQIVEVLLNTHGNYQSDPDSITELLPDLEVLCNTKFDTTKKIGTQLLQTADRINKMYSNTKGKFVTHVPGNSKGNYHFNKEWFEKRIWLPFENITLPVPENYDAVLKTMYGANYMTPVKSITHDYPFYKKQTEAFKQLLVDRIMKGEQITL